MDCKIPQDCERAFRTLRQFGVSVFVVAVNRSPLDAHVIDPCTYVVADSDDWKDGPWVIMHISIMNGIPLSIASIHHNIQHYNTHEELVMNSLRRISGLIWRESLFEPIHVRLSE